jgi:uncharacterized membrane protein
MLITNFIQNNAPSVVAVFGFFVSIVMLILAISLIVTIFSINSTVKKINFRLGKIIELIENVGKLDNTEKK